MRIALVTRSLTRNQGNVALSLAWKGILERKFPGSSVAVFERIPSRLKRYTCAHFATKADPLAAFDRAARKLGPTSTWFARQYAGERIIFDRRTTARNPSRFRMGLNIRGRLASLGLFDGEFADRQNALAQCDLMVMNAAGEFLPKLTDTPLQYLLDLRAAQLMGLKTAFVNTSFEIVDPFVRRIAVHVLDKTDLLLFRDTASAERYREAGGSAPTHVVADAAMLHDDVLAARPSTGRIAISLSARLVDDRMPPEDWRRLALALRAKGLEPVFVSNEWMTDEAVFAPWLASDEIAAEGKGHDVDEYVALLSGFDALVSARLHSCVMAMLAGTPVVPVELETTKISGFFDHLGLPERPIQPGPAWVDQAVDRAVALAADKAAAAARQGAAMVAAQDRLRADLVALLKPLA